MEKYTIKADNLEPFINKFGVEQERGVGRSGATNFDIDKIPEGTELVIHTDNFECEVKRTYKAVPYDSISTRFKLIDIENIHNLKSDSYL